MWIPGGLVLCGGFVLLLVVALRIKTLNMWQKDKRNFTHQAMSFLATSLSFQSTLEWLVVVSGSSWLAWLVEVEFLEVEELPLVVELLALLRCHHHHRHHRHHHRRHYHHHQHSPSWGFIIIIIIINVRPPEVLQLSFLISQRRPHCDFHIDPIFATQKEKKSQHKRNGLTSSFHIDPIFAAQREKNRNTKEMASWPIAGVLPPPPPPPPPEMNLVGFAKSPQQQLFV